jgi:magnesium-transporting ATPase (P-type)
MPDAPAPTALPGLTTAEATRIRAQMGDRKPPKTSRSYAEIIWSNTFTLFNLVLAILLLPMLVLGLYSDALFGFVLVANTLIGIVQETRAKRTLDRLALLVAPHGRVLRDGVVTDLAIAEIVPGDVVLVEPGDQVVADGEMVQASVLSLDESALTGESDAVSKMAGDQVLSGSFCVAGAGAYRVTAVGADSFAETLAAEAKGTRAQLSPLQLDINRILRVLIWVMVPMAALMVISSFWLSNDLVSGAQRTVAALVPLVPEGLVLLASLTFAVAAVRLGRIGTLAQQLNAIESLASVDVVCVDKTGTLTENRLDVVGVAPAPGHDEAAVRRAAGVLAASAAARNGTADAIARAMPEAAVTPLAEVPFASSRKWSGATLPGIGTVVLGAPEILERVGVVIPAELQARISAEQAERRRVLLLATGTEPLDEHQDGMGQLPAVEAAGAILLEEALRPDAPDTVRFLQDEGVTVKVISGDGVGTVEAVAAACGISGAHNTMQGPDLPDDPEALREIVKDTAVFGRITPEQKRALVRAMTANGQYVAMIGDGVNDVLALKEARLSVAMGNGSQMAKGVADLVLLTNAFSTLPNAIEAGRQIIRNTHRVAKLFITKSVYSALLLLAFALLPIAYPFLPRQLSITSSLTIGIPAFFLALAASTGPVRRDHFMRSLWAFCVPAGVIIAAAISGAYLLSRGPLDASIADARTAAVLSATFLGLAVVIELERGVERQKVRRWVWGMVLGFVVLLTVGLQIELLRTFFEVGEPTLQQWGLIAAIVAAGIVLLLGVRRIPWLRRLETPPADQDDLVALEQRG